MLAEKKKNTNIYVGAGLLTQLAGNVLQAQGGTVPLFGLLLVLAGTVLIVWGCVQYCQGKGYSGWFGLLGLLSILGLLILVFMPDRYKNGRFTQNHTATSPSPQAPNAMFDTRKK